MGKQSKLVLNRNKDWDYEGENTLLALALWIFVCLELVCDKNAEFVKSRT